MPTWNAKDLTGGDYGRVIRKGTEKSRPRIIGQGESKGFTATVDGDTVFIEWGTTVQVSTSVNGPGNASSNVPRMAQGIAEELARNDQLEQVS